MLSFNAVHTLTGCLLDVEASADLLGWGRPPLLLLVQDRPAPSGLSTRRQMRALQLPLNERHVGQYRAGLADFLRDLATVLSTGERAPRPTLIGPLTACIDINHLADLTADPTPDSRLLAWAVCYEDVLVDSEDLHEVRRLDAVDADGRYYQITRVRDEPLPVVFVDEQPDQDDEPATRTGLTTLVRTTRSCGPPSTDPL